MRTKIAAKESHEDLNQWITEVDGKILYADESVKSLKETLEELRHEELLKKQELRTKTFRNKDEIPNRITDRKETSRRRKQVYSQRICVRSWITLLAEPFLTVHMLCTEERLCTNPVKFLLSMLSALLSNSFEPRPNQCSFLTVSFRRTFRRHFYLPPAGSVSIIGFSQKIDARA